MQGLNVKGVGANTALDYVYRDASNSKATRRVVLEGRLSSSDLDGIVASLDEGAYFIPGQVGLPDLQGEFGQGGDWSEDDDHVWHTINAVEYTDGTPSTGTVSVTVLDLMAAWPAKDGWDEDGHLATLRQGLVGANRR